MSQPLIFNSKAPLPGFQDGDQSADHYRTLYHKLAKRPAKPFPCDELLSILWVHDTVVPDQRVSLGRQRRLTLSAQKKTLEIEASSKLGEAFFIESGILVDAQCFQDEIEMLIESALGVETVAEGQDRSASMRNLDGGYKTTVHIQEKPEIGCPPFCRMEVHAVCITVLALRKNNEQGVKDRPLVFGCAKKCVFRMGGLGLKWAVDLKPDGRPRRRWGFKGLRGAKGDGKFEMGGSRKSFFGLKKAAREDYGSDEEKLLLLD